MSVLRPADEEIKDLKTRPDPTLRSTQPVVNSDLIKHAKASSLYMYSLWQICIQI